MTKHSLKNRQRGAALLILVFFFIAISLTIVQTATFGALSELRTYRTLSASKFAYVAAEAGIEDAFYRIASGKTQTAGETITLNGATAVVTVTDNSATDKEIFVTGESSNEYRKLYLHVTRSVNAPFLYAAQVGNGGMILENGSQITGPLDTGDVYANGR